MRFGGWATGEPGGCESVWSENGEALAAGRAVQCPSAAIATLTCTCPNGHVETERVCRTHLHASGHGRLRCSTCAPAEVFTAITRVVGV